MTKPATASRRRKSAASVPRIDAAPAFILHHYPYRETSKLLDVFSRDHGRLMLVARGAQRPGSQLRAVLLPFQPVLLSWFGSGEVKTLHSAEWQGGLPQLTGLPLLCGFYLNELLLKLLPRDERAVDLFVRYFEAIRTLGLGGGPVEPALRTFELGLLNALGYAPDWQQTSSGEAIIPSARYSFDSASGILIERGGGGGGGGGGGVAVSGQTLLEASHGQFLSERSLSEAKLLMRQMLANVLGDAPLHTRQLLLDLQKL